MTKTSDAYNDHRPHRAGADSGQRTFDDAIRDQVMVKPTPFWDYLKSKKKHYMAEWRDQTFSFFILHVGYGILLGGVWVAVSILPPAF